MIGKDFIIYFFIHKKGIYLCAYLGAEDQSGEIGANLNIKIKKT